MEITVFTPTYNRGNNLNILYNSLLNQSYKDFEWLIVDDGSNDNTKDVIDGFKKKDKVKIRYYIQSNQGKHIAINKGVELAIGEYFFIVDSDDKLPKDSLGFIKQKMDTIKDNKKVCGISGMRYYYDNTPIGTELKADNLTCNFLDLRHKYKIKGDRGEVYKLSVLKNYLFPKFDNENFIAEGIIWNRIAENYVMHHFNKCIYMCEYLVGGLSSKSLQLRKNNPKGAVTYYYELFNYKTPLLTKVKAACNFWRFSFYNFNFARKKVDNKIMYLALPFGLIVMLLDKILNK